jgi:hypothetical protein
VPYSLFLSGHSLMCIGCLNRVGDPMSLAAVYAWQRTIGALPGVSLGARILLPAERGKGGVKTR